MRSPMQMLYIIAHPSYLVVQLSLENNQNLCCANIDYCGLSEYVGIPFRYQYMAFVVETCPDSCVHYDISFI